jgi:hypothetical protein
LFRLCFLRVVKNHNLLDIRCFLTCALRYVQGYSRQAGRDTDTYSDEIELKNDKVTMSL